MSEWVVLAPGPSMSADVAASARGRKVCAVNNAFEFAPWADILVANDPGWWARYPAARTFAGIRCSASRITECNLIDPTSFGVNSCSGVAALDLLRNIGARRIFLLGFDMRGTHFFGDYANGLRNTAPHQRHMHMQQFNLWAAANRRVEVINCTPESALQCFPMGTLAGIFSPPREESACA